MAYLRRDGQAIPFWRMASIENATLRDRAAALNVGDIAEMEAVPGGGTLPSVTIPSVGIVIEGDRSEPLRAGGNNHPPFVARGADGRTHLDLRTIDPAHDELVAEALRRLG